MGKNYGGGRIGTPMSVVRRSSLKKASKPFTKPKSWDEMELLATEEMARNKRRLG